jgi:hypothetical protein
MADKRQPEAPTTEDLLIGILTLLADDREQRVQNSPDALRTELLLDAAGLRPDLIARAVNKSPDAVRMMISRAKKSTPSKRASSRKTTAKAK